MTNSIRVRTLFSVRPGKTESKQEDYEPFMIKITRDILKVHLLLLQLFFPVDVYSLLFLDKVKF